VEVGVAVAVEVGVAVAVAVGVAVAVAVAVGVNVAVAVGVGLNVAVAVGVAVAVAVGLAVGVGEGVPHGTNSTTSSTYIPVSSPKPSWCTRNLIRTVMPAYGAMSTVWFTQAWLFVHSWKIVCR